MVWLKDEEREEFSFDVVARETGIIIGEDIHLLRALRQSRDVHVDLHSKTVLYRGKVCILYIFVLYIMKNVRALRICVPRRAFQFLSQTPLER